MVMRVIVEIEMEVDESANFISSCNSLKEDVKDLVRDLMYDVDDITVLLIEVGDG